MKKFLSLVLAVCMLLTMAAGAMAERVVLQNDMVPALIGVQCADGATAYAVVFDKDNNEVAHITDPTQIKMTDMTAAEGAAGIETHKMDYMLVMFDKFQVELPEDAAAKLAEGGYVQMVFGLEDWQPNPALVTVTVNNEIKTVESFDGEGTVTVKLPAQGVVAFMTDCGKVKHLFGRHEQEESVPGEVQPGNNNFTPSVSGKPAPDVMTAEDHAALIKDTVIEEVIGVPATELIITPVADRDYVPDVRIHGGLEWAYEKIRTAPSLNELPEITAAGLGAAINQVLADMGSNLTYAEMIVRDLFAVSLYGDLRAAVAEDAKYLNVTFDMGLEAGAVVVALTSSDNVNWTVLPASDVTVNANGSVTVNLHDLGTVAFAVNAATVQTGMVTSPATGE